MCLGHLCERHEELHGWFFCEQAAAVADKIVQHCPLRPLRGIHSQSSTSSMMNGLQSSTALCSGEIFVCLEFRTELETKVPFILEMLGFTYHTVWDKSRKALVPKLRSIRSAVSIQFGLVTDTSHTCRVMHAAILQLMLRYHSVARLDEFFLIMAAFFYCARPF